MAYDSKADTLLHIKRVNELLGNAAQELINRGQIHDSSKLEQPEKSHFDRETPLLKELEFGTPEYTESLKRLKVALDHHYSKNPHHPQHYSNGVNGMNLFDLVEMFFDWIAAGERMESGCIYKSIDINQDRFQISKQLCQIMKNTASYLGHEPTPVTLNQQ